MKKFILIFLLLLSIKSYSQVRDTLKLTITKVQGVRVDTVYYVSSRIDTIALQPIKTDTSKIVKDVNPQDLEKSKYRVNLMGSVRVNSYFDYKGMTSTEGFLPFDIPVGEETIDNLSSVYIGARQSRLGIEGNANTKVGQIKTYMEVDFASSSSSFWRLRHAYAEWNYFKIGYTWSTFMDNASLPTTVDFEGPNSALSKRHGVIRYERKYGEKNIIGISLEAPQTDYYNPADTLIKNKNKQSNFDLAGRYKFINNWGHIQVAGIVRRIDYLDKDRMQLLFGWGLLLSSDINLGKKHSLFLQYSVGEGIANYYVGFNSRQLDAIFNPNLNKMQLKGIQGGFFSYTFIFNPLMRVSLTGGISTLHTKDFEPDDSFSSSQYLAVNIFYEPIETINMGLELTNGRRVNKNEENGQATRISLLVSFDF